MFLTADELKALTGKTRAEAQMKVLRQMGIPHIKNGAGRVVVAQGAEKSVRAPDGRKNGPTQLYRHFDGDGHLLYVGVSLSVVVRQEQHKRRSGWFGEVRSITVQPYPSRSAAIAAEARAIREEKPKYNKMPGIDANGGSAAVQELEGQ